VILLLATKGVLLRPWCLIELLEASRKGIPIIIVQIANGGFDVAEATQYVSDLEEKMKVLNPAGLAVLQEYTNSEEMREVEEACIRALDATRSYSVSFDPHAGDNAMIGMMKDIVEQMGRFTKRRIDWIDPPEGRLSDTHGRSSRRRVRVLLYTRQFSARIAALARALHDSARDSWGRGKFSTWGRRSSVPAVDNVVNKESAVFLCCSRKDAISHARLLRSELEKKLQRGCAIGGGAKSAEFVKDSEGFVVLLTHSLATDPDALFEIWLALQHKLTIATVAIPGGFDFNGLKQVMADLPAALQKHTLPRTASVLLMPSAQLPNAESSHSGAKSAKPKLQALEALLPTGTDIASFGKTVGELLTAVIAISWSPTYGTHQADAIVTEIIKRATRRTKRDSARWSSDASPDPRRRSRRNTGNNTTRNTSTSGSRKSDPRDHGV